MLAFDLAWEMSLGALLPRRTGLPLGALYLSGCVVTALAWPAWQGHHVLGLSGPVLLAVSVPALVGAYWLGTRLPSRRWLVVVWAGAAVTLGQVLTGMTAALAAFLVVSGVVNVGALAVVSLRRSR